MSKDKISDYSATANSNTDIGGINIDEGCAPSGINDAIRTLMKQLKDFQQGTNSDPFNGPHNGTVGATTPASGAFTTLSATGNVTLGDSSSDTATINATATFAQAANLPNTFGFKNRIINGAMMIDQRNAGASVTGSTSDPYTTDRWKTPATQNSKFTFQQNAGSVTPPVGYINYLGATSSSAYAFGAGDYFTIQQNIEGLNTSDLGWGTASAATVTLSFWVRSSLTGAFGGSIVNSAQNRSYPFTYTISAANTWEQKTVTIAGDTSGTWLTTNGIGIRVSFSLGAGATYSGTAGAWAGSLYYGATGQVNVVGTSGATFYITGVQLEKGSTATSFDYRPYGTELALCQRYFEQIYGGGGAYTVVGLGSVTNSTAVKGPVSFFQVAKRATPTITVSGNYQILNGGSFSGISYTAPDISNNFCTADISGTGFTAGQSVALRNSNDTTAKITASAEL